MSRDTGLDLLFAAGQHAQRRCWSNPTLVGIDDLASQPPSGSPLIVTAAANTVTADAARTISALHAAGRDVLLITDGPLFDSSAAWIPAEALAVVVGADSPRSGPEAFLNTEGALESGAQGREPSSATVASARDRERIVESITSRLADHPDPGVRCSVASLSQTPMDVLDGLAGDPDLSVREAVAENPNTPEETLFRLAKEFGYEGQSHLAVNPSLPVALGVALDPSAWHLALPPPQSLPYLEPWEISSAWKAWSSQVTPEMLRALAGHSDAEIRAGVAFHRNVPGDVLLALSGDGQGFDDGGSVQDCVAANRCTPSDILRALARTGFEPPDDKLMMLAIIAGNPNTPDDLLHGFASHPAPWVRIQAAANPHLQPADLLLLAQDGSEAEEGGRVAGPVRRGVAENPSAPERLLRGLSADFSEEVAGNPSAPEDVLRALVGEHPARVAANPNAPAEVLRGIAPIRPAEVAANPAAPVDALSTLADDDLLAIVIAGREDTPIDLLRSLATRSDGAIKIAVAANPRTPEATLHAMQRALR